MKELSLEEIRDNLLKNNTASQDNKDYKNGYIDGALDMYNEFKKQLKRVSPTVEVARA